MARFWIKLTDGFINSRTFKRMEKIQNGHSYALLLIHLLYDTRNTDGVFLDDLCNEWVPLDADAIHDEHSSFSVDFIEDALKLYAELGYIVQADSGFLAFAEYEELTNTAAAAKQKRYRDRKKAAEMEQQ